MGHEPLGRLFESWLAFLVVDTDDGLPIPPKAVVPLDQILIQAGAPHLSVQALPGYTWKGGSDVH